MSGEQENSGNNSDNNVQRGGGSSNSGFLFSAKSGAGAGAIGSNHGSGLFCREFSQVWLLFKLRP